MTIDALQRLILRDLAALRRELQAYPREADIWACPPGIQNSAGTLALHVAGNLRHFIGAQLGGTGYARDRDAEFALRDVPRAELDDRLARAEAEVRQALAQLVPARLTETYPLEVAQTRLSTGAFLLHLATHLAYHLGQVDYHRRIVSGDATTVGAQAIPPLADRTA